MWTQHLSATGRAHIEFCLEVWQKQGRCGTCLLRAISSNPDDLRHKDNDVQTIANFVATSVHMFDFAVAVCLQAGKSRRRIKRALSLVFREELRQHLVEPYHTAIEVIVDVTVKQPSAYIIGDHIRADHRHRSQEN